MAFSPELIVALFFGIVGTALALAAFFHSHWVHLRTFAFLKRSHAEAMATKSGENAPLSAGGTSGTSCIATRTDNAKHEFIAKALYNHKWIYDYVKGQRTPATNGTWV